MSAKKDPAAIFAKTKKAGTPASGKKKDVAGLIRAVSARSPGAGGASKADSLLKKSKKGSKSSLNSPKAGAALSPSSPNVAALLAKVTPRSVGKGGTDVAALLAASPAHNAADPNGIQVEHHKDRGVDALLAKVSPRSVGKKSGGVDALLAKVSPRAAAKSSPNVDSLLAKVSPRGAGKKSGGIDALLAKVSPRSAAKGSPNVDSLLAKVSPRGAGKKSGGVDALLAKVSPRSAAKGSPNVDALLNKVSPRAAAKKGSNIDALLNKVSPRSAAKGSPNVDALLNKVSPRAAKKGSNVDALLSKVSPRSAAKGGSNVDALLSKVSPRSAGGKKKSSVDSLLNKVSPRSASSRKTSNVDSLLNKVSPRSAAKKGADVSAVLGSRGAVGGKVDTSALTGGKKGKSSTAKPSPAAAAANAAMAKAAEPTPAKKKVSPSAAAAAALAGAAPKAHSAKKTNQSLFSEDEDDVVTASIDTLDAPSAVSPTAGGASTLHTPQKSGGASTPGLTTTPKATPVLPPKFFDDQTDSGRAVSRVKHTSSSSSSAATTTTTTTAVGASASGAFASGDVQALRSRVRQLEHENKMLRRVKEEVAELKSRKQVEAHKLVELERLVHTGVGSPMVGSPYVPSVASTQQALFGVPAGARPQVVYQRELAPPLVDNIVRVLNLIVLFGLLMLMAQDALPIDPWRPV